MRIEFYDGSGGFLDGHVHVNMMDDLPSPPSGPRNKYDREIRPGQWVDVYDVLGAFMAEEPDPLWMRVKSALDHAAKKIFAPGQRGAKDLKTDIREARLSLERAEQIIDEWV